MTTLTVWPSQSVPSTGITSASATLPTIAQGSSATLSLTLIATDLTDATLTIDTGIEWSDGGANWTTLASILWQGGHTDRHTGLPVPPQITVSADSATASLLTGKQVRAYARPSRTTTIAATLTY